MDRNGMLYLIYRKAFISTDFFDDLSSRFPNEVNVLISGRESVIPTKSLVEMYEFSTEYFL